MCILNAGACLAFECLAHGGLSGTRYLALVDLFPVWLRIQRHFAWNFDFEYVFLSVCFKICCYKSFSSVGSSCREGFWRLSKRSLVLFIEENTSRGFTQAPPYSGMTLSCLCVALQEIEQAVLDCDKGHQGTLMALDRDDARAHVGADSVPPGLKLSGFQLSIALRHHCGASLVVPPRPTVLEVWIVTATDCA